MPGEFDLIRRFFSPPTRHTALAGGDDAALLRVGEGMQLAVSTDMLVAGRHFLADADAASVGHKSLAVNLSDMAAMGATPRWVTLSIALPSIDEAWVAAFARGFLSLAAEHDVDLIGGDTTRGPLNLCVQIMGEVPDGAALRRDGARVGDLVWVSGCLGEAALALANRLQGFALPPSLRARAGARLDTPQPRVALGHALRGVASAAIDVSDGLVADVGHIAERSGVRAVIDWPAVPIAPELGSQRDVPQVLACALAGGDDYELCFTTPPAQRDRVREIARTLDLPLSEVGRIEAGGAVRVLDADGSELALSRAGFDHFGD